MNRSISYVMAAFGFALAVGLMTAPASAQATRTWVSGLGDDANPCSRTAPCKTFAGAYSKTAAGGEIDVIDPGGYGNLTISKALTVDGGGSFASVLSSSGTTGFVVNAGSSDRVALRRLAINGVSQSSFPGTNNALASRRHRRRCRATDSSVDANGDGFLADGSNSNLSVEGSTTTNNSNGVHSRDSATVHISNT